MFEITMKRMLQANTNKCDFIYLFIFFLVKRYTLPEQYCYCWCISDKKLLTNKF